MVELGTTKLELNFVLEDEEDSSSFKLEELVTVLNVVGVELIEELDVV